MDAASINRSLRIATRVVSVLVTVALGGFGTAGCDSGATNSTPRKTDSQPAPAPVKATKAPGGGELRVVESGVSMSTDSRGEAMATYGLLLENTSRDQVAYDAEVFVTLLDTAGKPVTDLVDGTTRVTHILRFAVPGKRVGLGRYTNVPEGRTVAQVKVEIGAAWWLPTSAVRIAPLAASDVTTTVTDNGQALRIDFTVENGYPLAIRRTATAVLRNSAGAIIGGTGPGEVRDGLGEFPPGQSKGTIDSLGSPPRGIDLSRTEVYIHPPPEAFRIR